MRLDKVDAVIVGSGAAGSIVAKELAVSGFRVVVLERGPWRTVKDFHHDELRGQFATTRGFAYYGPDPERHPRTFRYTDREKAKRVGPPFYAQYGRTAAQVGGATVCYGAWAWRFKETDFRMKSTYGPVPGSSLEDWPISYHDLEPFYEKAEYELGVCGDAEGNPFGPPRRKPYPLPPIYPTPEGELLAQTAKRLGWHPFPLPGAIITRDYDGRPECVRCLFCVRFGCEVGAKSSATVTVIPKALATKLCQIRPNCMAKEILVDEHGRPWGVSYFGPDNKLYEQPARVIVISCSATESPRLLLNSKSRFFPKGIGNRYDLVGRNIMTHASVSAFAIYDKKLDEGLGPGFSIAVDDFNETRKDYWGGVIAINNNFHHLPLGLTMISFGDMPRWGREQKDFMRRYYRRNILLWGGVQDLPVPANRVDTDPEVRDAWGIPVARITHQFHPRDHQNAQFLRERMEKLLWESGAIKVWSATPRRGGIGEHQCGTCRMGDDPKTSVVDRYCRVHDVDNVFVVDGSVFVTSGGYNPSLTIQAIAYWASSYIVKEWRRV